MSFRLCPFFTCFLFARKAISLEQKKQDTSEYRPSQRQAAKMCLRYFVNDGWRNRNYVSKASSYIVYSIFYLNMLNSLTKDDYNDRSWFKKNSTRKWTNGLLLRVPDSYCRESYYVHVWVERAVIWFFYLICDLACLFPTYPCTCKRLAINPMAQKGKSDTVTWSRRKKVRTYHATKYQYQNGSIQ